MIDIIIQFTSAYFHIPNLIGSGTGQACAVNPEGVCGYWIPVFTGMREKQTDRNYENIEFKLHDYKGFNYNF